MQKLLIVKNSFGPVFLNL